MSNFNSKLDEYKNINLEHPSNKICLGTSPVSMCNDEYGCIEETVIGFLNDLYEQRFLSIKPLKIIIGEEIYSTPRGDERNIGVFIHFDER